MTPPPSPLVASGPAGLLALVPHRLGFHPADSVLLLELRAADPGTGRRALGLVVRGDLPAAATEDHDPAARAAAQACLRLVQRAAGPGSQVLVVLYDPDARATPDGLVPGARAAATLTAVRTGLEALRGSHGLQEGDHLLVGAGRWRTLTCSGSCCPRVGHPWSPDGAGGPAGAQRLRAEAVWRGFAAAADRASSLPTSAPPDPARCAGAAAARREPVPPALARTLVTAFDDAVDDAVGDAVGGTRAGRATVPGAAWCGRLLRALDRVEVRDALLLSACRGPSTPRARRHLLRPPGAAPSAVGAGHVARALAAEVDPRRAAVAAELAVEVARCGGADGGAQAWAVAAWLDWAAGRSVRAGACAGQALAQDPGHRLAALVDAAVRRGLGPRGEGGGVPAPGARTGAGGTGSA